MSSGNSISNVPRFSDAERLNGEVTWKAYKGRVLRTCQAKGLDGYLEGTIPRPNPTVSPVSSTSTSTSPPNMTSISSSTPSSTTPVSTPIYSPTPSYEEWFMRERWVADVIISNIEDATGTGLDETKRASEIFAYLTKLYEQKSEQRVFQADTVLRAV